MKFSDRYKYNKVFELWCKSLKYGGYAVFPNLMSAITWMETTPEGQEVVKKLYKEIIKDE